MCAYIGTNLAMLFIIGMIFVHVCSFAYREHAATFTNEFERNARTFAKKRNFAAYSQCSHKYGNPFYNFFITYLAFYRNSIYYRPMQTKHITVF